MDPLINGKRSASGAEAQLIALVEAADPVAVSEARKRHSLNAVLHRQRRGERSGWRLAMRLGFASSVLLAAGAATAAFGVHWRARVAPAEIVAIAPPPVVVHHTARHLAPAAPAPIETEVAAPPETPARPVTHARVARSEDPTRVVAAIQALRQDHDPTRAGQLLASYLKTYPHGALAEEAVALSIEAADARHSPAATAFAERYVRDYPNGRFRPAAERVLARTTQP